MNVNKHMPSPLRMYTCHSHDDIEVGFFRKHVHHVATVVAMYGYGYATMAPWYKLYHYTRHSRMLSDDDIEVVCLEGPRTRHNTRASHKINVAGSALQTARVFLDLLMIFSGPLNGILVFGGTVLEVIAPVSPCHSLVQNFMDSVCNIFWWLVNIPYFDVYFWLSMYSSDKV